MTSPQKREGFLLDEAARIFLRRNFLFFILGAALFGCSGKSGSLEALNRQQAATLQSLHHEIGRLNAELESLLQSREELAKTKSDLEKKLRQELASGNLSVSMQDRGLVVTVLDRVLFDSGKAELKTSSLKTLDKVAEILGQKVRKNRVYVEGHTDNEPIHRSGWRSNWELSAARATEVIHYFVDVKKLDPGRLAATGYGEFYPVAENKTENGRLKNRRVEIVISPKKIGS